MNSANGLPTTHADPSARAERLDGERFVNGAVRYLGDVRAVDSLHIAFVRSPHAHARIISIDVAAARNQPGVHAVLTGHDTGPLVGDLVCAMPAALTGADGDLTLPCLPTEFVRFVGEPFALVVAESASASHAAATLINTEFEIFEPILDIDSATKPSSRNQHSALPTNVAMAGVVVEGDASGAIGEASKTVNGRINIGRSSAIPLEPRGCLASWDADSDRLIVRATVQTPHGLRTELARQLQMAENDIRVIAPPLGGAFGFKFAGFPEEILTCLMAAKLKRSVRWVESRDEALLVGAREYHAEYTLGLDQDAKIVGLIVDLDANIGALAATPGPLMPLVAASTFPGPYNIGNVEVRWRAVMTNKGPWNGARGFGKEATSLILESAMDAAALAFELDPVDVRRHNLLRSSHFPHRTSTMTIDSGDYSAAMDQVLALSNYSAKRAAGRKRQGCDDQRFGLGIGFELTPEGMDSGGSLIRGFETATVRLDTSGRVTVLTGVTSPGTGSDTAIAQLVAAQLGLSARDVRVVQGDTDMTPYGSGSFSSRGVLVGGTAAWLAAGDLCKNLTAASAVLLEVSTDQVEMADGFYRVIGEPMRCLPVSELPRLLRSLGGAIPGIGEPQLEATRTYGPDNLQSIPDESGRMQMYPTYSYSVHVAEVGVDIKTGCIEILNLTAVHDCGKVINPDLVDAQLHGAVAMGAGLALLEEERYNENGQPMNTDFKRYILPRLGDLPTVQTGHICSPSPFTALGTKGAGESGVGGAAAAITGAVRDAIQLPIGTLVQLPMTPQRTLAAIDTANARGRS